MKDFPDWIKQMIDPYSDSLGPPIEDYLSCDANCECPKVPDANGVMRNHEAEYAAGMSAGRWIREQQIVRAMRARAGELDGHARLEILLLVEEIEGNKP
jgi:hypothetical protein